MVNWRETPTDMITSVKMEGDETIENGTTYKCLCNCVGTSYFAN